MNSPLPPRALAAPRHRPTLVVAVLSLCSAAAYLLWLHWSGGSPSARGTVVSALFIALDLVLVELFRRAARNPELSAGTARALRYMAMAAGVALVGRTISLYAHVTGGTTPSAGLADLFLLASFPLTLAAFLSIPREQRPTERWKLAFDAGMVLCGGGVALWFFVLRETLASGMASPAGVALAFVYPLGDLLILVAIVTVLLRHPADGNRSATGWLAISAALGVADDLFRSLLLVRGGPLATVWAEALHLAAAIALIVSAELFLRDPHSAEAHRGTVPGSPFVSALPFIAAGVTYALLFVGAMQQWVAPLSGLALGAIAVSLLLGARQLLSQRENALIVAEQAMHASEARFRTLVQNSSDLIFVLDADGTIRFASSSASRVIGYAPESLIGVALSALADPEDSGRVDAFIEMTAQLPGVSPLAEWRLRRPDGHTVQVEAVASNLLADPSVGGIVLNARDVGERKALLDQLAHQAFHDPLTGLANRALFRDRVMHAITLARREERVVTVLFLDLDDFKQINDSLGHAEGDRLLAMIAARLRASARSTDTVARLGGDEFAVLVEDTNATASTARLVERITEQMGFPFALSNGDVYVSASIGSASAVGGGMDEIMRYADVAMYSAKRSGRGQHRVFDAAMLG
ncbi:MAG: sensor domain-containing diguanylate cyclase [Gemmatimonadaceae bacterium]